MFQYRVGFFLICMSNLPIGIQTTSIHLRQVPQHSSPIAILFILTLLIETKELIKDMFIRAQIADGLGSGDTPLSMLVAIHRQIDGTHFLHMAP